MFLIALCVSIILEAITRFFEPQEVNNPQLILIVGCLGLASNLVGFFVLGGHGHSHGHGDDEHSGHGDDHGHEHTHTRDELAAAEEGVAVGGGAQDAVSADEARIKHTDSQSSGSRHIAFDNSSENLERTGSRASNNTRGRSRRRPSGARHGRVASIDNMSIYPASFRQNIIEATRPQPQEVTDESDSDENAVADESEATENTPLIQPGQPGAVGNGHHHARSASRRSRRDSGLHVSHNHNKPKEPGQASHGHSHGDMGMNAMILHVIGDALGNVGVIVTALIIWLTDLPGKYYTDPAVSLFITLIILKSAVPLTLATSKVLLQATPEGIEIKDIREDIERLPSVISCHHVHIWQLSDTKIVASMHIHVNFPISEAGGEGYMVLAKRVRKCLHAYGIHSATIQPEFCLDGSHAHALDAQHNHDGSLDGTTDGGVSCGKGANNTCLLDCVDDCVAEGCCATAGVASPPGSSHSVHSHGHDEHDGHEHH